MSNKVIIGSLLLMIAFASLLPSISAAEWDNIVLLEKNIEEDKELSIGEESLSYNKIWDTYKPLSIENQFGLGKGLLDGAITSHTSICGKDCLSEFVLATYEESALIQDIKFYTIKNGKRIEEPIRSFRISYYGDVIEYKTVCSDNGIADSKNGSYVPQKCSQVESGITKGWKDYNLGDTVPAGTYKIKLEGNKNDAKTVDWVIKTQGKTLDSWAVWGNISLGDTAEVRLDFPIDGAIIYNLTAATNATANVTTGAWIKNLTLWDNSTGTWSAKNTTSFSTGGLDQYYTNIAGIDDYFTLNLGTQIRGQTFTAGSSYTLTKVSFHLWRAGSPTSNYVKLYELNATGHPVITSVLATTAQIDLSGITTSSAGEWVNFTFLTPYTVTAGVTYGIFMNGTYSAVNKVLMNQERVGATYAGGTAMYSDNNGIAGSWTNTSWDNMFMTWGGGETVRNTTILNTYTKGDTIKWNMLGCDTDNTCGFATANRTFQIDAVGPVISIASPTTSYNYLYPNYNHTITFTATDPNLDKCWYEYNGTNTTLACSTGVAVINYFNQSTDNYLRVWANDSLGTTTNSNVTWTSLITEDSRTYSSTNYETNTTTFGVTATANSSLTGVSLVYNGTTTALTNYAGGIWNTSKQIAPESVGSQIFRFDYTYGGTTITGFNSTQLVKPFLFGQCNATTNLTVLNITFKDETTTSIMNATIDASTWNYSLTSLPSSTYSKSFIFSNTTHNLNYTFCTNAPETVYSTSVIQYSEAVDGTYPQRSQTFVNEPYVNSSVTTSVLYLLDSAHGVSSNYVVVNTAGAVIQGAFISVTRLIGATTVTIAEGYTDASGQITFFLNPNYDHTLTASATGYTSYSATIRPSSTDYTITLTTSSSAFYYADNVEGVAWTFWPPSGTLTDGVYNFSLSVNSTNAIVYNCTMNIYHSNGTLLGTSTGCNSSYPSAGYGGAINVSLNITDIAKMRGEYYIGLANGTYYFLERDAQWKNVPIVTSGGTSIMDVLQDLIDLPEWGEDERTTDFNRIVFFFLFLAIILAILNFFTGWDAVYPGAIFLLITLFVIIGSWANGFRGHGYFYLNGVVASGGFFGSFSSLVDNWILAVHFMMISAIYFLKRGSLT